MTQDDFKKLLEAALVPFKKGLDELRGGQDELKEELQGVKGVQGQFAEDLKDVRDTQQQQILPSVITIETEIKAYGDMYKMNSSNAKKLEKRIKVLENESGITPPPEFIIT